MGGYGSGRRKTHQTTLECLSIDLAQLRKHRLLPAKKRKAGCTLTFTGTQKTLSGEVREHQRHQLSVLVERYQPGEPGDFRKWNATGRVTLVFGVKRVGNVVEEEGGNLQQVALPLVTTSPTYGGARYWFLAPCCGRRCRVVYLPLYGGQAQIAPQCRECLDLHYASQQASYIERHVAYEKHLLANYGYYWAFHAYHGLKEHYFTVTPQWDYIKRKSVFDREMQLLRLLITSQRLMLKTDMHALASLRSEEDRRVYLAHLVKTHGESYALDLVRLMGVSLQLERTSREASPAAFERTYMQVAEVDGETPQDPVCLQLLIERKRETQEEWREYEEWHKAA